MKYLIEDIIAKRTGKTRVDGKYPKRIGSTVEVLVDPIVGAPLFLQYIKYNNGEPAQGDILNTSTIDDFDYFSYPGYLYVYTRNSIYKFKELE